MPFLPAPSVWTMGPTSRHLPTTGIPGRGLLFHGRSIGKHHTGREALRRMHNVGATRSRNPNPATTHSPIQKLQRTRGSHRSKVVFPVCLAVMHALLPTDASAQSIDMAHTAFTEGRFVEAAEIAEVLKTSEGYTLAAKSLAIYGHYLADDDEKPTLFRHAIRLAEEAVQSDADNPMAYLQLGHAMGRYAETLEASEVLKNEYPEKIRDTLKHALELAPDLPVAHLSFAAWHAHVRDRGGIVAGVLYKASKKEALKHYEKAIELAPDNKPLLIECAFGLLLVDPEANYEQAHALLARAYIIPSEDAFTHIVHQQAIEKIAALDARSPKISRHSGRLGQ